MYAIPNWTYIYKKLVQSGNLKLAKIPQKLVISAGIIPLKKFYLLTLRNIIWASFLAPKRKAVKAIQRKKTEQTDFSIFNISGRTKDSKRSRRE